MEIKKIDINPIQTYPKNNEITKREIKFNFLNKWKNIGITYAFVSVFLGNKAYGLNLLEEEIYGYFPTSVEVVHELNFFGKTIELSSETYDVLDQVQGILPMISYVLPIIIVAYIIAAALYNKKTQKKLRGRYGIILPTIVEILLILVQLFLNTSLS